MLDQPCGQQAQILRVATVSYPFKLILALDLNVGHHHRQHLFMHVDSSYPIWHRFPPGGSGERAASSLTRVTGYRRSHRTQETTPTYSLNHARSGSDTRTASASPLRTQSRRSEPVPFCIRLEVIFMRFHGPSAQQDTRGSPEIAMVCSRTPRN